MPGTFEFCPYCGRAVTSADWTFCPACGKSFTAPGEPAAEPVPPAAASARKTARVGAAPTQVVTPPESPPPVSAAPLPIPPPAPHGRRGILIGLGLVALVAVLVVAGAAAAGFLPLDIGAGPTPEVTYVVSSGHPATPTAVVTPGQPSGTFVATGSMNGSRASASATLLQDGRVLILGGVDVLHTSSGPQPKMLGSAELYDPATGTFSPTASIVPARYDHTATLLRDGRVLIAGGYDGSAILTSAQLYDPSTGAFSATGSLTHGRLGHTATLLASGQVLIAGGFTSGAFTSTAELYDPVTGTFSPTGSMTVKRLSHGAALLQDGRVLIAGGGNGSERYSSAELYDPTTGTFSLTGSMAWPRANHRAITLPDGRVLIAGGGNESGLLASAEFYNPNSGTFAPTGSMTKARDSFTATLLLNGRVLIAGGELVISTDAAEVFSAVEVYDPSSGTFSPTDSMTEVRAGHTATLLQDGRVLIAGGFAGSSVATEDALNSAELYQP